MKELLLVFYNKIILNYSCTVITVHYTVHTTQNRKKNMETVDLRIHMQPFSSRHTPVTLSYFS